MCEKFNSSQFILNILDFTMLYTGMVYSNEKAYAANFGFVATERLKRESYFD
jgi:hypothetical protein